MEADQNTSETAAEKKKKGNNDHIFPLLMWSEWKLVYIKSIALVTLHHSILYYIVIVIFLIFVQ